MTKDQVWDCCVRQSNRIDAHNSWALNNIPSPPFGQAYDSWEVEKMKQSWRRKNDALWDGYFAIAKLFQKMNNS